MTTQQRAVAMVAGTGFVHRPEPGFVGFSRKHQDGRTQVLRVFYWSNTKQADKAGIPHAYMVVCLNLDVSGTTQGDDKRYRIPLVDWPSAGQPRRPWSDVAVEFRRVFLPVFDAPLTQGRQLLDNLTDRYIL